MRQTAFKKDGKFFKGNLHTHTEHSDGKRPVGEVVSIYKGKDYDFLAVTDHNRVFKSMEFNEDLYIIPAMEIHSHKEGTDKTHHIVALTTYDNDMVSHEQRFENFQWSGERESCDDMIAGLKPHGFNLIYCHSMWSRTEPHEFSNEGLMAMEVYNGVCDVNMDQGNQEVHWDMILRSGHKLWAVAADDCHGRDIHYGLGYVMVKAEELSDKAIISAIEEGAFYSSQGPEIYDFYVDEKGAYVECSPASMITFITYESRGFSYKYDTPETKASIFFHNDIDYVRVEITDEKGRKAWSNPIFVR